MICNATFSCQWCMNLVGATLLSLVNEVSCVWLTFFIRVKLDIKIFLCSLDFIRRSMTRCKHRLLQNNASELAFIVVILYSANQSGINAFSCDCGIINNWIYHMTLRLLIKIFFSIRLIWIFYLYNIRHIFLLNILIWRFYWYRFD